MLLQIPDLHQHDLVGPGLDLAEVEAKLEEEVAKLLPRNLISPTMLWVQSGPKACGIIQKVRTLFSTRNLNTVIPQSLLPDL